MCTLVHLITTEQDVFTWRGRVPRTIDSACLEPWVIRRHMVCILRQRQKCGARGLGPKRLSVDTQSSRASLDLQCTIHVSGTRPMPSPHAPTHALRTSGSLHFACSTKPKLTLPRQSAPSLWISTVFSSTTSVRSVRPTRLAQQYPCVLHLQSLRGSSSRTTWPSSRTRLSGCLEYPKMSPQNALDGSRPYYPHWHRWNLQKLETGSTDHIDHPLCRLRVGKRG